MTMKPVPEFGGLTAQVSPDRPGATVFREQWGMNVFEYRVRFAFEGRPLTGEFRTGTGWTEAPTPRLILETYFREARDSRDYDADEYAREFGFDLNDPSQARQARRSYAAATKIDSDLRALFGEHFEHAERVFQQRPPGESKADEAIARVHGILTDLYDRDDDPDEQPEQAVRDLLTDLCHYVDAYGIDLDNELERAHSMAAQEQGDWT